jgi:hypothetical protein
MCMSETRRSTLVLVNTVVNDSVKFAFPRSINLAPMSIYAHVARQMVKKATRETIWQTVRPDRSVPAALSVRHRRQIGLADMSETATRETVADLTLCGSRGRFTFSSLEFSIAIAFDGCGDPRK